MSARTSAWTFFGSYAAPFFVVIAFRIASCSTRRLPSIRTSRTTGSAKAGAGASARMSATRRPRALCGRRVTEPANLDRGAQKLNRLRRAS